MALLAIASFVACSRDDDNSTSIIVGVWKEEKRIISNVKDSSFIKEEVPTKCEKKGSRELTKDGKYISKSFLEDRGVCIEDGTYTYDASTKKIVKDSKGELEVISLTATELQLLDVSEDENKDGVKDKTIFFLKRQK